ncbi:MAG: MoaD/ThiS family protein [Nanoarchaeota archaeon]|nr:MoaD/ThiS family protein [Nanoarchaeota archaeon]
MVSVKAKGLSIGERELRLNGNKVKDLLTKLNLTDDAVIIINKKGEILTSDRNLKEGEELTVIEVFSGG